jgi:urease accessory protein
MQIMKSLTRIHAERAEDGGTRLSELSATAPISLRETPDALYLVASGQGLLDDDLIRIEIVVGAGAQLRIRSAAATIAYTSRDARLEVNATVGAGGRLEWLPEPLIATATCHLVVSAEVDLDLDASLDWLDECLLGRSDEQPGSVELGISVERDASPLLRHRVVVGEALTGWDGPAILGPNRAIGQRVLFDPRRAEPLTTSATASDSTWAVLPLDAGGVLITALGADLVDLRNSMAEAAARVPASSLPS